MGSDLVAVPSSKQPLLQFLAGSRTLHEAKEVHQASPLGVMRHRMRSKAPPKVSIAPTPALIATSVRATHASCCSRCVGALSSQSCAMVVHCSVCGDSMHAQCAYPPLPDVVCTPEIISTWVCEPCLHDQALQGLPVAGKYPFCMECAEGQRETWRLKDNLVACVSCRASYHQTCAGLSDKQDLSNWTCSRCSTSGCPGRIRLKHWSLELVQQQNGRVIPVVRGTRCDQKGPLDSLWRTSEIVHALTPTKLITRKWVVIRLIGPMSKRLAQNLNLPKYLMVNFKSGFKLQSWMSLVRYARCLPPPALKAALSFFDYEPDFTPLKTLEKDTDLISSKDNRRHAKRTGRETKWLLQKRIRSTHHWTAADVGLLQKSLLEVRPSTPHFWQRVAACVGKPATECQAHAFGPVSSRSTDKHCRDSVMKNCAGNEIKNQALPTELGPAPKKDGPRRAQRVRTFLNARCFGRGRDFLYASPSKPQNGASPKRTPSKNMLPETDLLKSDSNAPQFLADAFASPTSINFLDSLHTGCTPTSGQKLKRVATPFSMASSSMITKSNVGTLDDDGDDDDVGHSMNENHLDLGDCTWQPIGLDSFICEARDRRNKLARSGKLWTSRARTSPHSSGTARVKMRRASGLYRKVKAAMDATPKSVASESEDELAPVAAIPLYTGVDPGGEWP